MSIAVVAGVGIAVLNQLLLIWRLKQLELRNISQPEQIVKRGWLSFTERLLLGATLLALVIIVFKLNALVVFLSFFITNLIIAINRK